MFLDWVIHSLPCEGGPLRASFGFLQHCQKVLQAGAAINIRKKVVELCTGCRGSKLAAGADWKRDPRADNPTGTVLSGNWKSHFRPSLSGTRQYPASFMQRSIDCT
jgi:hypothetical protein